MNPDDIPERAKKLRQLHDLIMLLRNICDINSVLLKLEFPNLLILPLFLLSSFQRVVFLSVETPFSRTPLQISSIIILFFIVVIVILFIIVSVSLELLRVHFIKTKLYLEQDELYFLIFRLWLVSAALETLE